MSDENKNSEALSIGQPSQVLIDRTKKQSYEFMNPETWRIMNEMAKTFINSGALPSTIKNAAQLVMVFQAGSEVGLKPVEALNSFYFVNGKIALWGEAGIALVIRAGHQIEWGVCNELAATCTITRLDNRNKMSATFTMQQAVDRGLTRGKDVWTKFPENMLKFKAFWQVAKFHTPDALHNIPIGEILEGEAIEGTVVEEQKKNVIVQAEVVTTPTVKPEARSLEQALKEDSAKELPVEPEQKKTQEELDDERYEEINQRARDGEKLSASDRMFVGRYETQRSKHDA